MPAENGSVSPSAAAVATAASTALPPRLRTFRPILVASGSTLLTAPPYPSLVAFLGAPAWADAVSDPLSAPLIGGAPDAVPGGASRAAVTAVAVVAASALAARRVRRMGPPE